MYFISQLLGNNILAFTFSSCIDFLDFIFLCFFIIIYAIIVIAYLVINLLMSPYVRC